MRGKPLKLPLLQLAAATFVSGTLVSHAATLYVNLNSGNPTPPYSDWSTAATNIQDAINAASNGDQIWVTNGVYNVGGLAMAGSLTNRVALNKALTVQSVNGPFVTTIQGAGASNGTTAVRCAWLTNYASLIGFTLTAGATQTSGDVYAQESGGGVWSASTTAMVTDCIIVSNTAFDYGDGAYQGTLNNCLIASNGSSYLSGGAVYLGNLNNCTVVSNSVLGTVRCFATNSIIYYDGSGNYSVSSFSYCCVTPSAFGAGNFTNAPRLFPDEIHLAIDSPCVGAGTMPATAADIFGNSWGNPPSIGCAELAGMPLIAQLQVQLTSVPVGFTVGATAISGAGPFTFAWFKDGGLLQDNGHFSGTQSSRLVATGVSLSDAGGYQLVVSNSYGAVTSAVEQVVVHCVDVNGVNPVPPYTNWMIAATNIQDAITAASAQDIILVTNGVYATGGKSMDGIITNRVSLDKMLLVQSVNGPSATVIQGAWDPVSTNGPGAVRCVWMTNSSILNGFTLSGGATRTVAASVNPSMSGGGLLASSKSATVWNCVFGTNYGSYVGGGAYSATLNNCTFIGNHAAGSGQAGAGVANAGSGGGAVNCNLLNCLFTGNAAHQSNGGGAQNCDATNCAFVNNTAPLLGSGIYQGYLMNCTVKNNTSGPYGAYGGAAASATLVNCIVYGNFNIGSGSTNYNSCTFSYSDSDPLPSGAGNIDVNPQMLADNIHLAMGSPCIGAGTSSAVSGTDIDGQAWNNPPSMGCDEWQPIPVIVLGPSFLVGLPSQRSLGFNVLPAGQSPFSYYWYYNGSLLQDNGHYNNSATSNLVVSGFEPEDAGAYQVVVSNSFGAVTSQVVQVVIHAVDAAGINPLSPYTNWSSAATQIQDAINAAKAGDIVLVTDGVYSTGGKVVAAAGDITNRIALNKVLTVISVNGYGATLIIGQKDPVSTYGSNAVRCAWLTGGAVLDGFTLAGGASCGNEVGSTPQRLGGGALLSTNAVVYNCVFTNNTAYYGGGGVAFGTVNNSFIASNTVSSASFGNGGGGGAYGAILNNCTVRNNQSGSTSVAGGIQSCTARNCIVLYNYGGYLPLNYTYPGGQNTFLYSCTDPLPSGTGNIDTNVQFLDPTFHLPAVSAIRGAGSSLYATGTDLDDQAWASPPSMGCSELVLSNLVGPLAVAIRPPLYDAVTNFPYGIVGAVTGRASSLTWSLGDGTVVTNAGGGISHVWTNAGDYTVTLTAYNLDNPSGVSTNLVVVVDPLFQPMLGSVGFTTNNAFQFSFQGQFYATYYVQYATNLAPPIFWQTFVNTGGPGVITITDPSVTNPTNTVRFYRVLVQ